MGLLLLTFVQAVYRSPKRTFNYFDSLLSTFLFLDGCCCLKHFSAVADNLVAKVALVPERVLPHSFEYQRFP